jgi:hypothetical protein
MNTEGLGKGYMEIEGIEKGNEVVGYSKRKLLVLRDVALDMHGGNCGAGTHLKTSRS